MKSLITIVLVLATSIVTLVAGTVTIMPLSPKPGAPITIEYTPESVDASIVRGEVHAVLYTFTVEAEAPRSMEVILKKQGQRWVGTATMDTSVVYAIIKVGNGSLYDTNKGLFWECLVAGPKGTPAYGAHLRAALARYGQLPAPCRMKDDFPGAIEELNKEIRLHPSNIVAKVNYIFVMKNTQQMEDAEAVQKAREVTSSTMQAQRAMDAIALAQAYEMQGKQEQSLQIMMDAAQRFPRSAAAEQSALATLQNAQSLEDFVTKASEHINAWPESFARQNIVDGVLKTTTQQGALRPLIRFLDRTNGVTAMSYHQAVNYIGANDTLRSEALRLIDQGIAVSNDAARRPAYYGNSEWRQENRIARSELYFVKGAVYRAQGKPADAIAALEKSMEIGEAETEKNCYEMLIGLYRDEKENKKALKTAEKAISTGASTQGTLDAYRALLAQSGVDSSDIAARENELRKAGRASLSDRLSREMLNLQPIDGVFTTLDGKKVNVSDWKGKVVLIDYWATWCGPCRQSFPALQKLYERYRSNPNVVFAVVNVWERSDDRVKTVQDFLSQNKNLTMPMLIDPTDAVVGAYGVTGIPTKFFLGKDGRIQFKEVGGTPEEQFLEDAGNKIDVLLAQ